MSGTPPPGFTPHFRKSPVTDPWEPLFSRVEDRRISIGFEASASHCNARGLLHGGVIAALADNAMGLTCVKALGDDGRTVRGLVTVSLSVDYLGAARLCDWVMVAPEMIQAGGSLAFARALVSADETPIARASATFKLPRESA